MTVRLVRLARDQLANFRRIDHEPPYSVSEILEDVRARGLPAVREHGARYGDLIPDGPLLHTQDDLQRAFESLDDPDQALLVRTTDRIRKFAEQQLASLRDFTVPIPGGSAGQRIAPVERAGCYAPGGRFSLPSTVLMTAATARAAGVRSVWVASPRPQAVTLGAAWSAGADGVLGVGGAQAIAALAYGVEGVPPSDVIVGPGNRWVTAAKELISPRVRIDLLAGPSELVVLADESATPELVAADLLAQAEHDVDGLSVLVTTAPELVTSVEIELERQLAVLITAPTARAALSRAAVVVVADVDEGADVCNEIAPEHLQVHLGHGEVPASLVNFGGLFIDTSHVFGDYGSGPNHVLPTGGTARSVGGLSVFSFLRVNSWLHLEDSPDQLISDVCRFARLEGLEAHARAAALRAVQGDRPGQPEGPGRTAS